tara:strand:- start:11788 stop:12012 length:225 start_codon:yes stop_codon:yes gene_type:complete
MITVTEMLYMIIIKVVVIVVVVIVINLIVNSYSVTNNSANNIFKVYELNNRKNKRKKNSIFNNSGSKQFVDILL